MRRGRYAPQGQDRNQGKKLTCHRYITQNTKGKVKAIPIQLGQALRIPGG